MPGSFPIANTVSSSHTLLTGLSLRRGAHFSVILPVMVKYDLLGRNMMNGKEEQE